MLYYNENLAIERIDSPDTAMIYDFNSGCSYTFEVGDYVNGNKITYNYGYCTMVCSYIYQIGQHNGRITYDKSKKN